jgi:hypothetical protein
MPVQQQNHALKRTIIIGLGGTGRDVLMRIRRFIIDKHGKIENFPVVSFVHLDTDKNSFSNSGLPTGNTYHGENILLQKSEQVLLNVSSQAINDLMYELENESLSESPYSHIASWLNPQLKNQIGAIQNGANGIRPIGRLAFFYNFRSVKEAIEKAEERTQGHEAMMSKKGFEVQDGLEVFVIGSLCGGTGSGIFLDVAYTVRKLCNNLKQVFGYFVIAPKLYSDTALMKANTYAALKELNHYTKDGTTFSACYDKQNQLRVAEKRPPFDFPYLVSNRTFEDYQINDKSKLCNVIAYKIFLELSSELVNPMREVRDDFRVPMYNLTDLHPFKMCQGYITFGLASIYFTRDRIVQLALNRLAGKLLDFWLRGSGQSPDSRDLLDRFLLNWTGNQGEKNYLIARLEDGTQENNKSFTQSVGRWKSSLESEITGAKTTQDLEDVKQNVVRTLRSEFRKVQPGDSDSSRGSWLTACKQVQPTISEQLKHSIDDFLRSLLDPDAVDFSLNNALAFLEALQTQLNQYKGEIEERRQESKGLYTSDKIENILKESEQNIEDLSKKGSLLTVFSKNRNLDKIKTEIQDCVQKVNRIVKHNFTIVVNEEATKIIEALQKHITDRRNQIQQLKQALIELTLYHEKHEEELKQLNLDEMTGEGIFPEEAIDTCIPDNGSRDQLVSVSHQITRTLTTQTSLFYVVDGRVIVDGEQIRETMNSVIEKSFQNVGDNKVESVIKRFIDSYPLGIRSKRLEQIRKSAKPLLSMNLGDQRYKDEVSKVNHIIAFKQEDKPEVKQLREMLSNDLGVDEACLKPIQAEDEIILITEYAGFPLRIINNLQDLRGIYEDQEQQGTILHNERKNTIAFSDILPPEAKLIEDLEYIFYPSLAFGILTYNSQSNTYDCTSYDSLLDQYDVVSISYNWREAIEILASRQDITDMLKQNLDRVVVQMLQNPSRLTKGDYFQMYREFAIKVNNLPEDNPNYLYKSKVIGTNTKIDQPATEGIITRFVNKIKRQIEQMPTPPERTLSASTDINHGNPPSLLPQVIEPEPEW